jgi:glycosyltransferase involved in cell wall biosynthesis
MCWRGYDASTRQAIFSEIALRGLTNVKIQEKAVNTKAYLQRFLSADCYINIATGEGFSIQPREAMALGIPAIVTDNTGQKIVCSSGLVRVVPSNIEVPAMYSFPGDFGVQYQCLTNDVAEALRDVYDNYDLYLQKGQKAREWASEYHYTRMKPLFQSLIKPKKIVFGAEDKILQDGIMITSKKLVHKYKKVKKAP